MKKELVYPLDQLYNGVMELQNIKIQDKDLMNILKQYYVLRLFLFGSVLTDHFTDQSDIDLLVEFEKDKSIGLFDLMDLKRKLQTLFGRRIDLVEKEGLINPYKKEEILRTSRKIYG
ncbi:MAG: nucleotidyltransferase domain-containing protein [Spirochaetaceae bacterium]|jgi:predicted nucleotidyltransferase|nr:nucleotidyltransferase domain-containing protein [Spirochaetaceae bacterium]